MYIKWFTWIIFFDDNIYYTKILGVTRIIQFSQCNGKLPLSRRKQGNYVVINIYDGKVFGTIVMGADKRTVEVAEARSSDLRN